MRHLDAVLLIADIDLLHHTKPVPPDEPITIVGLPEYSPPAAPPNTILLSFDADTPMPVQTRTRNATVSTEHTAPARDLIRGLGIGDTIKGAIRRVSPTALPDNHTPIVCALRYPDGWHTYSRTNQTALHWCFIRTSETPVPAPHNADLPWLDPALAAHTRHATALNNAYCATPPGLAGMEVEVKFTLDPTAAVWPLATDLHRRLLDGDILAMIPRFGVDFAAWDYDNHLFEVTAPADQRGYVSFMSIGGDGFQLKRKQFEADALTRRETLTGDVHPDRPRDAYVRDTLHRQARRLPTFRRVRYDILMESAATGNRYSILLDRCTLHDDPDDVLAQCEIEYRRTQSVLPLSEDSILGELNALCDWTANFLSQHLVSYEIGYYSKLSFLRDVTKRREVRREAVEGGRRQSSSTRRA
jgi:hypothetical protein